MELSRKAKVNMEFVLEEVCREFPHGGDHEARKFIAVQLSEAVERGQTTIEKLEAAARQALNDLRRPTLKVG